jgi:hypothetical protein
MVNVPSIRMGIRVGIINRKKFFKKNLLFLLAINPEPVALL